MSGAHIDRRSVGGLKASAAVLPVQGRLCSSRGHSGTVPAPDHAVGSPRLHLKASASKSALFARRWLAPQLALKSFSTSKIALITLPVFVPSDCFDGDYRETLEHLSNDAILERANVSRLKLPC